MRTMSRYFYGFQLPTEQPFREALKDYRERLIVISVALAIALAAALLVSLVIVVFQAGYWYIVVIALLLLLGGWGGGSSTKRPPPPSGGGNSGTPKQPEKAQPSRELEKVLVPAHRPTTRVKMFAVNPADPDGPPIVIEKDVGGGRG